MIYPNLASMPRQTQEASTSSDTLLDRNNRLLLTWAILGIMAAAATAAILSIV